LPILRIGIKVGETRIGQNKPLIGTIRRGFNGIDELALGVNRFGISLQSL
jgi:hypothetical protein